jgi:hypothetical protein
MKVVAFGMLEKPVVRDHGVHGEVTWLDPAVWISNPFSVEVSSLMVVATVEEGGIPAGIGLGNGFRVGRNVVLNLALYPPLIVRTFSY